MAAAKVGGVDDIDSGACELSLGCAALDADKDKLYRLAVQCQLHSSLR